MEENQVPNQEPQQSQPQAGQQQYNNYGGPKKKKGLGPVKGTLLALCLAIIIIAIGLLIRMCIAGDGDYILPFKQMFGIEEEEGSSSEKKSKKTVVEEDEDEDENEDEDEDGQTGDPLGGKYTLLSSATSGAKVEHYKMSMDLGKIFKKVMDEIDTDDLDMSSSSDDFGSIMSMGLMILDQFSDVIDGEIYCDIYFEGNDLIQFVFGYDYDKLLTNLYKYMKKNAPESLEEENITSVDDLRDYIKETLEENLTEDVICEMIMDSDDAKDMMDQIGLKEKDIKDAIDIVIDDGLIEFYVTGTTKLKGIISLALGTKEFKESISDFEDEYGVKIDEDDVFASMFEGLLNSEEFEELEDYGMTFVKIK